MPSQRGMATGTDGLIEIYVRQMADASTPEDVNYTVELRFDDSSNQGLTEPVCSPCPLSPVELRGVQNQPRMYGEKLSAAIFHDERIRSAFTAAKATIEARNSRLRVSVVIDPAAPHLHALAWELLVDPVTQAPVATNAATPFSRFLFGRDWTSIPLLRKGELKVLVAVPEPSNLEEWDLAEVDAAAHVLAAREALQGVRVDVLAGPVTLDALVDKIAEGFDVLYLACHGALITPAKIGGAEDFRSGFGEDADITVDQGIRTPVLYLERDATRQVAAVSGGRFARRLADLGRPLPRLVVLASCESAGLERDWTGQSAQASLAPRLARAGVPALVAMQGRISMETANQFIQPLFSQLVEHGSIDQAVAAGRSKVRDRSDYWMPALFLRLKGGRLWYEPSFVPGAQVNFDSIAAEIVAGRVTPILGWGLANSIYGSKTELSERLAAEKRVPLAPHRCCELPLVSQCVQLTDRSHVSALNALKERMRVEVLGRFRDRLAGDSWRAGLGALLRAAGKLQRSNELDPYRIVAHLPAKVFINASPDDLLIEALKEAGKTPLMRTPQWRFSPEFQENEKLNPTEAEPLVVHVFGHFTNPESLALGEDDFLDYLMGVAQNQALLSNAVKQALTNRALLFLGFSLTDWSFRVLFRVIVNLMAGARDRQSRKPNVAVQVEPDGTMFSGPDEARYYLQKFYGPSNIEPYWGTSEDFLAELWPRVKTGIEKINSNEY